MTPISCSTAAKRHNFSDEESLCLAIPNLIDAGYIQSRICLLALLATNIQDATQRT
jgi:hypothetical protein